MNKKVLCPVLIDRDAEREEVGQRLARSRQGKGQTALALAREIGWHVAQGRSNKAIAGGLVLSTCTVEDKEKVIWTI